MIEAVGHELRPLLLAVRRPAGAPTGQCCCKPSSCRDDRYESTRRTVDFIKQHYIFPGGSLPSLGGH
jgi:cyclopropane fatty-acyl-phospholipid synthase-like methyltransferase